MSSFRESFLKFMMYRRGRDAFGNFLIIISLILMVAYAVLQNGMCYYGALILMIYELSRFVSKNIYKRDRENKIFLSYIDRIKNPGKYRKKKNTVNTNVNYQPGYRYFNCPSCSAKMRAPSGKGRIRVTCSKCGTKFETIV